MRLALRTGAFALGIACAALVACNKTNDRNVQSRPYVPSAAEQRRMDERRAEDLRAQERRAEERIAAAQREEERLAEERRAAERRAEESRTDERKAVERRTDARTDDRRDTRSGRAVGGGPNDPVLRATASSALTSLANARCDREVRCNNVGAKEKFKTRADCVAEMERDKRDDLNSDVCPGGIREKQLNECMAAIRDENCGNPLDALTRLNACRSGSLCAK
jgi:Family of unknown function (DUF6184)